MGVSNKIARVETPYTQVFSTNLQSTVRNHPHPLRNRVGRNQHLRRYPILPLPKVEQPTEALRCQGRKHRLVERLFVWTQNWWSPFQDDPSDVPDADGTLLIFDAFNDPIRTLSPDRGTVSTVTGSGSGFADGSLDDALFSIPRGIAVHPDGWVAVADSSNHRVRYIRR